MQRRFLPEFEARLPLITPYATYSQVPLENQAAWKAPFGPAETWGVDVVDTAIDGPHGSVPLRVYTSRDAAPAAGRPGLVWIHGGAFCFGDLDMPEADAVARGVAGRAGAVVVSVDYRLCVPPAELGGGGEDRVDERGEPVRFPVPHDDCFAVFAAVRASAGAYGIDPARLAIGGASAGGCLAAGVTLRLVDEGAPPTQLFAVYPALHAPLPEPSADAAEALAVLPPALGFAPGTQEAIHRAYVGELGEAPLPRYAYAGEAADLSGFPPTYVENAELDTLRPSGEAFVAQLRAAGVDVEEHLVRGVPHGHLDLVGLPAAAETMTAIADRLARLA